MAAAEPPPNGKPTWRDLQAAEDRCREAIAAHETNIALRLDRAHGFANDRLDALLADMAKAEADRDAMAIRELAKSAEIHAVQDGRIDRVESVLDQMRGAKNAVYTLIGSNVLLAAVTIYAVFVEPNVK
jgi:hypothetical protein